MNYIAFIEPNLLSACYVLDTVLIVENTFFPNGALILLMETEYKLINK